MKRRDMLKLTPLSLAGMAGMAHRGFTEEVDGMPVTGIPGKLSEQYQKKALGMLTWIKENQSENLLEASHLMARTILNGGTNWASWDQGHSTSYDTPPDRPGLPAVLTQGYNTKNAKKGDLLLINRGDVPADAEKKNITVVAAPAPWGSDAKLSELIVREGAMQRIRPKADIWIETQVTTLGAVMHIPGMPSPTGPISGILGQVTMWMMVADACRILARNGKSVPVSGDEPKLAADAPRVGLYDPLMDHYFAQVTREMEMIWAEMGSVRKIAKMAVDSVLAGGKMYGYSWFRPGLSAEAQTRRGGLTLSRGATIVKGSVTDYSGAALKGGPNDLVIMGLTKPNDPTDLAALDQFKRMNMKTASIGPMTREIKVPGGRAVPKETDVHVGRMCDTYGLYAVPGFDRKVCPTSGPLQLQIWWITCMEIADEIIRRTNGNVPGAFLSGAIKGGSENGRIMDSWWKERGY